MIFPLRERSAFFFFFFFSWLEKAWPKCSAGEQEKRRFLREDPLEEPFLRTAGGSGWD